MSVGTAYGARKSASCEWYTPPSVFEALGVQFDLDVASPGAGVVPWVPAHWHLTKEDDGLTYPWPTTARVWCNPPYKNMYQWVERFVGHGNGVLLVYTRTDTKWWQLVNGHGVTLCFVAGRVRFVSGDAVARHTGTATAATAATAPTVLVGMGSCREVVRKCGLGGVWVPA